MISQSTIDAVFDAARLEEVIGDFVQLKRSGASYKGLSPFSQERSPSFMVSPAKQIWKDFSSGKGGNVITFLMEHEHFTYPEAIKFLAKKYGIELEETAVAEGYVQENKIRESLYLVNEFAKAHFENNLWNVEQGKAIGGTYFKERGFTEPITKLFGLGYALDTWDDFTQKALKQSYDIDQLTEVGLTIKKDNKSFDRFRGRVMFPIYSLSGRVLGFGGRILINDKQSAKYVNSPESPVYQKSAVLYGLFQAKQTIVKEDHCYLVEGYTDVVQLYQLGIKNVVASSGTALTAEQVRLIGRFTKHITVLFDGDAAGERASLRGIDLILEQGVNVKICNLPPGEDPDSFAKTNTYEFVDQYLKEHSQDFIQYKASTLHKNSDPLKRSEAIHDIIQSIAKIDDSIKQEIYIQECSRIMGVSEDVLFSNLALLTKKTPANRSKQKKDQPLQLVTDELLKKVDFQAVLEQQIMSILLLYGNIEAEFQEVFLRENDKGELEEVTKTVTKKVYEKLYLDMQEDEYEFANVEFLSLYKAIIEIYTRQEPLVIENVITKLSPEEAKIVVSILMQNEKYELHQWEKKDVYVKPKEKSLPQLINDTISDLRLFLIFRKIQELENIGIEQTEETEREKILADIKDYQTLVSRISRNSQGRRLINNISV